MTVIKNYLKKSNTPWVLFVLTAGTILVSSLVQSHWDLALLDEISSPSAARSMLEQMSAEQKIVHVWFTATLDVIFPIVLGGFLASVAIRSFERFGWLLALIPLVAIPVDLVEGVVQILALSDTKDLLDLKAFITPLKIALFTAGIIIALVVTVKWLVLRSRS